MSNRAGALDFGPRHAYTKVLVHLPPSNHDAMAKRTTTRRPSRPPVGNAIVGQSGGPTMVINQSLVGVVTAAQKAGYIQRIYGARHGVAGILADDLLDLSRHSAAHLEKVAATPSAGLGSVRKKPTHDECLAMFDTFAKRDIRYLFYIGGNDSAETANIVLECAREVGHPIRVIHVPKTIDNDLKVTDHCPGFGSAAKFVAQAFMGDDLDNRSLAGIKINVVMGRHAGFLTAAAALGRKRPDDGPHLVYVPEVAFDLKRFERDVKAAFKQHGRCVIAVSEGIADAKHVTIAEKLAKNAERDAHGNVQLSGTGALGDHLASYVKGFMPKGTRVRADTFGYLQRSMVGVVSERDAKEARAVGEAAVKLAGKHESGTVVLERAKGKTYRCTPGITALKKVAKFTKSMPRSYMNRAGNDVTQAYIDYAAPLVGKLPPVELLRGL